MRAGAASVLLTAVAKGFMVLTNGRELLYPVLFELLRDRIVYLLNNVRLLSWIWFLLPDVTPQRWFLALFSSGGLCAAFFLLFTFFLDQDREELGAALTEAKRRSRVSSFRQSASLPADLMNARRDLSLQEIALAVNNDPQIRNWDQRFTRSTTGQVVIAAVGGSLSFLLGKAVGG
jgi:hypothetical protein